MKIYSFLDMKARERNMAILLLLALAGGVFCLFWLTDREEGFIDWNTEALSNSESYSLGDCVVKSTRGTLAVVDLFCNPETDEFTLHGCEYSYGYPSMRTEKCVFE